MRLIIATLALVAAMPAPAQFAPTGRPPVERPLSPIAVDGGLTAPAPWREVSDIRRRIDSGRDAGALSRREARRFDREARRISVMADRYGEDGLSMPERRELEARTRVLREMVDARRVRGGAR